MLLVHFHANALWKDMVLFFFFFFPPLASYRLNNIKQGSLDNSSQCRRWTTLNLELWRRHCRTTFAIFLGKSLQLIDLKKKKKRNLQRTMIIYILKGTWLFKKNCKRMEQTFWQMCAFLNWRNFHNKSIYMHFQLNLWKAIY